MLMAIASHNRHELIETNKVGGGQQGAGFKGCVGMYHAGASDKMEVHNAFLRDELEVVVATVAFGMGMPWTQERSSKSASCFMRCLSFVGCHRHYKEVKDCDLLELPARLYSCSLLQQHPDIFHLYQRGNKLQMSTSAGMGARIKVTTGA